jgi:hypothetical protein
MGCYKIHQVSRLSAKATDSEESKSTLPRCMSSTYTAPSPPQALHQPTLPPSPPQAPRQCRGFINRSTIGVGVWRFVEGGEHDGAIRYGASMTLPNFRSCNGGETLRAAIIHYMETSARLQ